MKKKGNSSNSVEESLVDLYLNVKIRKQDEVENMDSNSLNEERENLKKMNPLTIIEYIKNSIDILIDLKVEEKLESQRRQTDCLDEDKVNEYEALLRKLEADIRQHIKMEHQLKLHSESLQQRIDELEKENSEAGNKKQSSAEKNPSSKKAEAKEKQRESEINILKTEVQNLKQILKSYEDQAIKLSDLEKKLRNQNIKHEKEIKTLEEKYKTKIKIISKKISGYEEMLKMNTSYKTLKKNENEEELDRVNYDDVSHHDINKSHLTSRKSPIASTERKRDADSVKDKIDHYKKLIDKKINEISHSNINKTMNKSGIADVTVNDRSSSNHSFLTKDKTLDNTTSKSYRKNYSLIKNLENATKKILAKENYKTHYRHSSMEVKYDNKVQDKSPNALTKNIHAMKEMLFNNNGSSSKLPTAKNTNPKQSQKHSTVNNPTSNIILNQGGNPCFNQITIYTTNNTSNTKPNDLNLRQYIFNKVNKPKSSSKLGTHTRSASNVNH